MFSLRSRSNAFILNNQAQTSHRSPPSTAIQIGSTRSQRESPKLLKASACTTHQRRFRAGIAHLQVPNCTDCHDVYYFFAEGRFAALKKAPSK